MKTKERFLRYVDIWTSSERGTNQIPSAMREFDLANLLAYELKEMGVQDVCVSNEGIVYASLSPSKGEENCTAIGLIAHLDTAPEFKGNEIRPQIIENYDGTDITLGTSGLILSPKQFPELEREKGNTLITTDGTTLLGADGKAGIAEIMAAAECIIKENIPHGPLKIAFLPDEEIGAGTDFFDLKRFGAKYAYTVDGWEAGEIVYENFNAANITIFVKGREVHTGKGKGKLQNAQLIAIEINEGLPRDEIPSETEEREGFYHLRSFSGDVSTAKMVYAVRDHDEKILDGRLHMLIGLCQKMNRKYGADTVSYVVEHGYRNMREKIEPCYHLIEHAVKANQEVGIFPRIELSRGGSYGARLSHAGIPCPNLGMGGRGYHGPMEHISVERMDLVADMLVALIRSYAGFSL